MKLLAPLFYVCLFTSMKSHWENSEVVSTVRLSLLLTVDFQYKEGVCVHACDFVCMCTVCMYMCLCVCALLVAKPPYPAVDGHC